MPPNASVQGWEAGKWASFLKPGNAANVWATGNDSTQPVGDTTGVPSTGDIDSGGRTWSMSNAEAPVL